MSPCFPSSTRLADSAGAEAIGPKNQVIANQASRLIVPTTIAILIAFIIELIHYPATQPVNRVTIFRSGDISYHVVSRKPVGDQLGNQRD